MSNLIFAAAILIFSGAASGMADERPQVARAHAGIINDHHGILSNEDLERADEDSFPVTPFDGRPSSYPYWQCFDKKFLHFKCSYQKPLHEQGSSFDLEIKTKTEVHSYSHAHAISGEVCAELKQRMNQILRGQRYFCINGTHDAIETKSNQKQHFWSFYRVKTKLGYAHYQLP